MALEIGQTIDGKYRIVSLIGEGGMGAVYAGENIKIKRKVAIKVLHAGVAEDAQTVVRFEREAQAAGTIDNDHILEILDLGELAGGERYMVMEFLDGEPLSHRIRRLGRMTPEQICPIARQMLEGLQAAHAAGIIHRDLKPDNIFILREKAGVSDYVKIIDFGISKFQPLGSDAKNMTRTGAIMGTPYYMSPEQARGSAEADLRSDLYAVGVILFEAVTAQVPFEATSINELLFKIVLADPRPLSQIVPGIDSAFASIVSKAMAREPSQRFQTAAEFIAALDGWAHEGKAVVVPQPIDPRASVIAALEGRDLPTQATQPTGNTWAHTNPGQPSLPPAAAPRVALFAVLGVSVVLLLLAGSAIAWKVTSGESSAAPATAAASSPTVADSATAAPPAASASPTPIQPSATAAVATPTASAAEDTKAPIPVRTAATPVIKDKVPAATATASKSPPAKTAKPATKTPDFGY